MPSGNRGRRAASTRPPAVLDQSKVVAEAQMHVYGARAMGLGLDWARLFRHVRDYGPVVLDAAEYLIRQGLSVEAVTNLIATFGPEVLGLLKVAHQAQQTPVPGGAAALASPEGVGLPFGGAILKRILVKAATDLVDRLPPFVKKYLSPADVTEIVNALVDAMLAGSE
jgi:hypothetical protein